MPIRYTDLVEAYYSDGAKTVVKFHADNLTEYKLKYTNYTPWNTQDKRRKDIMPPKTASGVHELFAYAHAAIAGCRFAKWYYIKHNGEIVMPHYPYCVWTTSEE